MSIDSVLVTASAPTAEDLAIGAMQAVSTGRLDRYDIDGAWPTDPLVTVAGHRDDSTMIVQVGRPRRVARANAADLTADLFVRSPDDGSGRLWLTDLTMLTPDDPAVAEAHYLAVMALAAPMASAHDGYLVITSGDDPEVVPLDGVPDPAPLSLDDEPERAEPVPPAEVFVGAVLRQEGPALQGWATTVETLRTLCQRMPALFPDHVLTEEEWQPLSAISADGPELWPDRQSLFAAAGQFSWAVDASLGDADVSVCKVLGRGPSPDDASPSLGQGLVELAPGPLDYGYAHPWHPDEPWTGAVGPRMTGSGPYFMLAPRLLDQGLPNLYWLQVIGPRWVERIGSDRIATTPVHRVAEVAPDRWLLQLAPSLRAVLDDYPAFAAAREAAVDHLGREHFPFLASSPA